VLDVGCHCLGKPIAVSYRMFAAVMNLTETLHLRGMSFSDISRIDGNNHIIEHFSVKGTSLATSIGHPLD
jgi:hypothetical protein